MSIKRLIALTATAALIATAGLAQTAPQPVQQPWLAIVLDELAAAGFGQFEVETDDGIVEIEARNAEYEIERYYTPDGVLLRESVTVDGVETERVYDAAGNVISEEIDRDDD